MVASLDIFLRAVGIGFAIAAPVGPIGLLCIRRTLVDGRAAGVATGPGAATADAVYGLMVAAGFAATGVLVSHARPLAIGGGMLIAWLGLMSVRGFLRAPVAGLTAGLPVGHDHPARGVLSAWATTFALTLSNPMTILAFVGMVAALGSAAASQPAAPYWLVGGVFAGSALWWLLLVQMALVARTRLTPGATRWLDLGSGIVLLLWGGTSVLSAL
ncbi:putative LysE/RhtB family amino acid efflux pump [Aliiruegeria haliotis]|uniref:Putative LysE/RhtB family amino acid efflux pump n=1 Tax=Aliiruegeria haliotis TaxID=1280846 RepID=A0A2T0RUT3_9RHOB|nr:LysE family transporter [Aliiruegeria haliotis]PRY24941.1 putative LysE/RhtB family amino acid efflux pump [Aliiruegeria haliotis]